MPAGYALGRRRLPWRGFILLTLLLPQAFPSIAIYFNIARLFYKVGLNGTIIAGPPGLSAESDLAIGWGGVRVTVPNLVIGPATAGGRHIAVTRAAATLAVQGLVLDDIAAEQYHLRQHRRRSQIAQVALLDLLWRESPAWFESQLNLLPDVSLRKDRGSCRHRWSLAASKHAR